MNYNKKSTNEEYHLKTTEELERELQTNVEFGLTRKVSAARAKKSDSTRNLPIGYIINSSLSFVCILILYYIDSGAGAFAFSLWFASNLVLALLKNRADRISDSVYRDVIQSNLTVIRDGIETEVPSNSIVKGDLVVYSAGDSVSFASYVISSEDLSVITDGAGNSRVLIRNFSADAASPFSKMMSQEESENKQASKKILLPGDEIISGTCKAFSLGYDAGESFADKSAYINSSTSLIHSSPLHIYFKMLSIIGVVAAALISILGIFIYNREIENLCSCFLLSSLLINFTSPEFYDLLFYIYWAKSTENSLYNGYVLKNADVADDIEDCAVAILPEESIFGSGRLSVSKIVTFSGEYPLNTFPSFDRFPKDAKYLARCACCINKSSLSDNAIDANGKFYEAISEYLAKTNASCENYNLLNYRKLSSTGNSALFDYALIHSTAHTFYVVRGEPTTVLSLCNSYLNQGRILDMDNSIKTRLSSVFADYRSSGFDIIACARREYSDHDKGTPLSFENSLQFMGFFVFFKDVSNHTVDLFNILKSRRIRPIVLFDRPYEEAANYVYGCELFNGALICNQETLPKEYRDFKNFDAVESYDVFADLSPLQRKNLVAYYEQNSKRVLFVGNNINDFSAVNVASASVYVDKNIKFANVTSFFQNILGSRDKRKKEFYECDICKKRSSAIAYGNSKSINNLLSSSISFSNKFSTVVLFVLSTLLPRILTVLISVFTGQLAFIPSQSIVLFFALDLFSLIAVLSGANTKKTSHITKESAYNNLIRTLIPSSVISVVINIVPLLSRDTNLSAFSFIIFSLISLFNVFFVSGIGKDIYKIIYFIIVSLFLTLSGVIVSIGENLHLETVSPKMWLCATALAAIYSIFSYICLKYGKSRSAKI